MIILKFLSVTEELFIIQDQSRADFGLFGNSRVLKCYRERSNLGDSVTVALTMAAAVEAVAAAAVVAAVDGGGPSVVAAFAAAAAAGVVVAAFAAAVAVVELVAGHFHWGAFD